MGPFSKYPSLKILKFSRNYKVKKSQVDLNLGINLKLKHATKQAFVFITLDLHSFYLMNRLIKWTLNLYPSLHIYVCSETNFLCKNILKEISHSHLEKIEKY